MRTGARSNGTSRWRGALVDACVVPLTSWWQLFAECVGVFALAAIAGSLLTVLLGWGMPLLRRPWDPAILVGAGVCTLSVRFGLRARFVALLGLAAFVLEQMLLVSLGVALGRVHFLAVTLPGAVAASCWAALRATRRDLWPSPSSGVEGSCNR